MRREVVRSSSTSRLTSSGLGRSPGVTVEGDDGIRRAGGVGVPRTGVPGVCCASPGAGVGERRAAGEDAPGWRWADGVGEPPGSRPGPGKGATEGSLGGGDAAVNAARDIETVGEGEASSTSTTGMSSSLAIPRFGAGGAPASGFPSTPGPEKSKSGMEEPEVGMLR